MSGAGWRLVATALWRRIDVPGLEHFRLWSSADAHRLEGTIVVAHDRAPLRVEYEVSCSQAWETTRVTIVLVDGETTRRLGLIADDERRWWVHNADLPAVAGCVDVDLGLTPSTNMLPIRRLDLVARAPGASVDVTAAWVRFPELAVEPFSQRYTRVSGRWFRYESDGGRFRADLEVDDIGLVVSYGSLWERVAVRRP